MERGINTSAGVKTRRTYSTTTGDRHFFGGGISFGQGAQGREEERSNGNKLDTGEHDSARCSLTPRPT
jgi:hypothetical protein